MENTCACVLGPWPWPRAFLSLASRGSVLGKAALGLGLGLGFFLCPWPWFWPRALCPRLHLWSTDHHLVVCSLRLSKPWPNKTSNRSSVTYRINWEALEDKEVRKQFASSISSKFRQLPDVSEDIEREWLLFRSAIISSAAESCGRKRLRMAGDSEKRTPWWNQEVKEAIRAKKDAFKAWLQDRSLSHLQSRYTEARKAATLAVKKSKEKS